MSHEALPRALRSQIEGFVARIRAETRVPGIGVAVSVRGERFACYTGTRTLHEAEPLGADARFHMGCVTKLLIAAVALETAQSGALDLDAPIGRYLSELRHCAPGRDTRVEHLLSHTSGYRGTYLLDARTRVATWPELVAYLHTAPLLFQPGTVFSYEHTEAVLLGEILRRVTGRASLDLVRTQVLDPLGIVPGAYGTGADTRAAGCHRFDPRAAAFLPLAAVPTLEPLWEPAFSVFTITLAELLAIAELVSGAAVPAPAHALLSARTRRALATSVVRLPPTAGGPLRELLPVAFGLGTGEMRDGCRGNTGLSAGQCLGFRFDARTGVCVAVTLNAAAPFVRDFLLATLGRELVGAAVPCAPVPFAFELAALTGTYLGPGGGTIAARFEDGRLVCLIGRENRTERLRVELALDAQGQLVLRSPVPQLSIGFFAEPHAGDLGLMLGLSSYRRVAT